MSSPDEDKPKIRTMMLDNFMKTIGEAMEIDLENDHYNYEDEGSLSDKQKDTKRKKLFDLTSEYISEFESNKSK